VGKILDMPSIYQRTPEELMARASRYWPQELRDRAASIQVLPLLLETQEKFISILQVADKSPEAWERVLDESSLAPNLFLKHLMVLANVSGEILKRTTPLGTNKDKMKYIWNSVEYEYCFKSIHKQKVNNSVLGVDTRKILRSIEINPAMKDVIMLILFGSAALNLDLPAELEERCTIGGLLGNHEAIARFVRQRYIVVSAILRGAISNELGHEMQKYVKEFLEDYFRGGGWSFRQNGTIPGISQTEDMREITFDIVAQSPANRYFAIEVSFQVTTNSVIERKAGQAQSRYQKIHAAGHKIAYVIDGAGNLERQAALRTICEYSDCTVAFSTEELKLLAEFLDKYGGSRNGSLE
jgi:hypothetical protein